MIYQSENFNGSLDFRCRLHHGWQVERHIHEYSELLYCSEGSCEIVINEKAILLSEKQFVWIPPNYIHQYNPTDANVICAVFSNDFIPLYTAVSKNKRLTVKPINAEETDHLLEGLYKIDKNDLLTVSGVLNLICAKVINNSVFEERAEGDGILYQKVISYISAHFTENITLHALAQIFGYNEKYLSHSLHTLTGVHFTSLIAMYRIELAKKLLLSERQKTISAIALASGFSALNTFNRAFKKMVGMTPLEYRKEAVAKCVATA